MNLRICRKLPAMLMASALCLFPAACGRADVEPQPAKISYYDDDRNLVSVTSYVYDDMGNLLTLDEGDADSDASYYHLERAYEYDKKGNMLSYSEDQSGLAARVDSDHTCEYTYDDDGNCLTETYIDKHGSVNHVYEYEYDDDGRLLRQTNLNGEGTVTNVIDYECDAAGNITKETNTMMPSGMLYYCNEYAYDEYGNIIFEISSTDWGINSGTVYSYVYDDDGNILVKTGASYDDPDNIEYRYEYTYDDDGNMLTKTYYELGEDPYTLYYVYEY